jgi:hypothetical protein
LPGEQNFFVIAKIAMENERMKELKMKNDTTCEKR